jgi:UDP-N-acetylglucosamine 2-epimerase
MFIKNRALSLQMSDRKKNKKKTKMIESLRLMTFMINIEKKSYAILTPSGLSARHTSILLRTSRTVFVGPKQFF